jgi:hypothetical protein
VYFVIRKNAAGQFWHRIVGDNNEIMAVSDLAPQRPDTGELHSIARKHSGQGRLAVGPKMLLLPTFGTSH